MQLVKFLRKIFRSRLKKITIYSPLTGKVVNLKHIPDIAFSDLLLGNGVAIVPTENLLLAPVDGVVDKIYQTKHAFIINANGFEVFVHIGLHTFDLRGVYITSFVKEHESLTLGQHLYSVDFHSIQKIGFDITTPVVISNLGKNYRLSILVQDGDLVVAGNTPLFTITRN